jgi:hypothetical protein
MTGGNDDNLGELVAQSLAFQRKWQRLSMTAYTVSTVGILFCTTGGTYAAASNNSQIAAALAAVSTILIGLEKSLLFREKWKFHLAIATRLSILQTKLRFAGADTKALGDEYAAILDSYANSIPIAGREGQ